MNPSTDEVLLQHIAAGNEEAFALLYERYGKLAYSLAYRVLGNTADAEEAVQDAFLNIWRSAKSFDFRRGQPRTWMLSVVHHRAIDSIRKRRRQPPLDQYLDSSLLPVETSDVGKELSNSLERETLEWARVQIPPEQWQVIELAYFDSYTHREIAQHMGIPLGTVKGRIRIGMEKLRNLLKDRDLGV